MKIVFMGTPDFAVPALLRLIESPHEVVLVVTQPSRPKGRGRKPTDPPVKRIADEHGIPVLQTASVKREPIDAKVRALGADMIVVVAFGQILPESLLSAPKIGCLNIHASMLPEYRGAAPVHRAIMDGRAETGVTIMEMRAELDAGPIVAQQTNEIFADDDSLSLGNILAVLGADMLMRVLDEVEKTGRIESVEQDHTRATHAPRLTKSEGQLDWSLPTERIMFRLRGLTPWPGLWTDVAGRRARIAQAEPLDSDQAAEDGATAGAKPGDISAIDRHHGLIVRTGDGHLLVTRIQPEGKDEMEAVDFLNGAPLVAGRPLAEAPRRTGAMK